MKCPWGEKAFGGYFGEEEKSKWAEHDATELVKKWKGEPLDILIDVVCSMPSLIPSRIQKLTKHDVGHSRQLLQAKPITPRKLFQSGRREREGQCSMARRL